MQNEAFAWLLVVKPEAVEQNNLSWRSNDEWRGLGVLIKA